MNKIKLTIAISIACLLLLVHADIDMTMSDLDNMSFRIRVGPPISDPASNIVRIRTTYQSYNIFSDDNKYVGIIWSVTTDGGPLPNDAVSNTFVFANGCENPSGCTSSFNAYTSRVNKGTFDGKSTFFRLPLSILQCLETDSHSNFLF